jgi:hypothetical protein
VWHRGKGWQAGAFEGYTDFYADHYHLPPLVDSIGDYGLELDSGRFFRGHPFRFNMKALWRRSEALGRGAFDPRALQHPPPRSSRVALRLVTYAPVGCPEAPRVRTLTEQRAINW